MAAAAAVLAAFAGTARSDDGSMLLELNKLEAQGSGCRAYIVVTNKTPQAYPVFKLDLIQFQPDGLIGRRFAIDLGPIKADKRVVKLFDMENTACDQIGSFLINDVLECQVDKDPKPDCLAEISTSSLTKAQFTK
jgi:hypothetical protein